MRLQTYLGITLIESIFHLGPGMLSLSSPLESAEEQREASQAEILISSYSHSLFSLVLTLPSPFVFSFAAFDCGHKRASRNISWGSFIASSSAFSSFSTSVFYLRQTFYNSAITMDIIIVQYS